MNILKELLDLINQSHTILLTNRKLISFIYISIFIILFLETAIIPAFFLPGDSLLIIVGILIEKGILNFFIILGTSTIAVSLGSWISYLQGKFLKEKKIFKKWLSKLPHQSYQKAQDMLSKYGLCTLFISRFIMFIRTILPTIVGLSGLNNFKFQLFNWISSFLWVLILIIIGFILSYINLLYFLQ